jgi:biopolymer transport protein TolR
MIKNYFSDFFSKKDSERIYEGGLKNQNNSEISQNNFFDISHLRRNQRRKKGFSLNKAEINVIPLIDILLVLLVVFMITAETINSNVDINLPKAKAHNTKDLEKNPQNEIMIYIDSKGEISLNNKKFINLEEFESFLHSNSLLKSGGIDLNPDKEIIFLSDKDVNYQKIIEILVSLNNIGIHKIKMAYKNL